MSEAQTRPPAVEPVCAATDSGVPSKKTQIPDHSFCLVGRAKSLAFAERLAEVVKLFGASTLVSNSVVANVLRLTGDADELVFFGRAKKFCEYFMARLMGTEHTPVVLTGAFKTWSDARLFRKCILRRPTLDAISLAQSLFKAKVLIGHSTDRALFKGLEDHRGRVSSSVPDNSTVDEIFDAIEPVLEHLRVGLRARFERIQLGSPAAATGSWQSKRRVGGKAGWLLRAFHGFYATHPDVVESAWPSFAAGEPSKVTLSSAERGSNMRFSHGVEDPDLGVECEEPQVVLKPKMDPDGYWGTVPQCTWPRSEALWDAFIVTEALDDVQSGRSDRVNVTAVSEAAAKVRVVTSGTAATARLAMAWQQEVFAEMRELPCFPSFRGQLTGLQVTQLLGKVGLAASSDFTSATDLLNPRLTNRILEELCADFPVPSVIMDDNADKTLFYPPLPVRASGRQWCVEMANGERYALANDKDKCWYFVEFDESSVVVTQTRTPIRQFIGPGRLMIGIKFHMPKARKTCGQLMGQVTSFPLLCLVNLGCSLAALRRSGVDWITGIRQVFINGDDRLANSYLQVERDFWLLANPIGLRRSPGKSHESPYYASLNSQDYVLRGGGTWVRVPVVRSGLLFGIKKLATDEFRPSLIVTALFETMPRICQPIAVGFFLKRWSAQLQEELQGRNLFLPVALNGMGQVPPSCWGWHITPWQRACAERLMLSQPFLDFSFGPQWPSPPQPVATTAPWEVPTAPYDVSSVEWELATFAKRHGRRLLIEAGTGVACWCEQCKGWLSGCPHDCPVAKRGIRVRWLTVGCYSVLTGTYEEQYPKIDVGLKCSCHGFLGEFRDLPPIENVVTDEELRAACRPSPVDRPMRTSLGDARPCSLELWCSSLSHPKRMVLDRRIDSLRAAVKGFVPLPL